MQTTAPVAVTGLPEGRGLPPAAPLVVFDLDRTLLPGSSLLALARGLARTDLVSRRRVVRAIAQNACFRRSGAGDALVERLRGELLAGVAGLERAALVDLVEDVADELVDQARPGALLLLERHRSAGDPCVIVSASPDELVAAIGRRVGVTRAIGTVAEVADGRFTGRLVGPLCYGDGKLTHLRTRLGPLDTGVGHCYSDSASDLPLLELSARPVAVNPDRRLRRVATERAWPIVDFAR